MMVYAKGCGCGLDDFMPCSSFALEGVPTCCTPAYKHLVKNGELNDIVYSTEKPEEYKKERKETENNVFRGRPFICKKHLLQFQK